VKNHFPQLLKAVGVTDARRTEVYFAELLVPEPSAFVIEKATEFE
jgi:hypothetical protein